MRCPFIYKSGKRCDGYVCEVKIIKAKIYLKLDPEGNVIDADIDTPYHIHVYCSKKENHAGWRRHDDERMKFWDNGLYRAICERIKGLKITEDMLQNYPK